MVVCSFSFETHGNMGFHTSKGCQPAENVTFFGTYSQSKDLDELFQMVQLPSKTLRGKDFCCELNL